MKPRERGHGVTGNGSRGPFFSVRVVGSGIIAAQHGDDDIRGGEFDIVSGQREFERPRCHHIRANSAKQIVYVNQITARCGKR